MTPVVLYVEHHGKPKMVGKVLPNGVFYHAAKPDQYHFKCRCSYPIDIKLIEFLLDEDIHLIHCGRHDNRQVLSTTPEMIMTAPAFDWGGRLRLYLPDDLWVPTIMDYEVPWISSERVL